MSRKKSILIRLNNEELNHINNLAQLSGYSRESYIRMLINKVVPPPLITTELDQVLKQLRKVGANINQIAYIANSTKYINYEMYRRNYEELQRTIFDIKMYLNMPTKLEVDNGYNKDMGG